MKNSHCWCVIGSHSAGLVERILGWRRWSLSRTPFRQHHHGFGTEGRGFELHAHSRGYGGFEGAHGVAGGAGAATERVTIQRLSRAARCSRRVLHLLQRVQHHVRGVLSWALSLQLTQLVQSCVHCLLYVLVRETERRRDEINGTLTQIHLQYSSLFCKTLQYIETYKIRLVMCPVECVCVFSNCAAVIIGCCWSLTMLSALFLSHYWDANKSPSRPRAYYTAWPDTHHTPYCLSNSTRSP